MEILYIVLGLLTGGLVGWLVSRNSAGVALQELKTRLIGEEEKNKLVAEQVAELKRSLEAEREKAVRATNDLIATETNFRNLEEKLEEQKDIQKVFTDQFRNLANEIFEEKSKKFTDQNKSNLTDLLKPFNENIAEFKKRVEDTHKDTITRNAALREQLENLQRLNLQMTKEAENLTRALKGDSKTQGAWGEFILESILEKSGLERDREYSIQESFTTEDGRLRPDVIVRLPENRHVIIDSKVSLTAYNNFVNAQTEEEKATALKAHLLSIRQHMRGLTEKNYQNISEQGLDFIIMFIPIEPAYILAIQSERNLYEEALQKRIVFVSPTLLIPSLQLIKNVWKQEYQNRHVLDIANRAGALYDKFVGFTEDLINLGRQMDLSKKSYDESMKKLTSGSGNLTRSVEELKRLGAKANKNIDPKLLKRAEDQADLFGQ
ncbi:MAG: DNA recombination protein RmuC [Flammeovirgaceae bacterium]